MWQVCQETSLRHDGPFLSVPSPHSTSKSPTHCTLSVPAKDGACPCQVQYKGYLGEEAVQVLDVVPGAWAQGESVGTQLSSKQAFHTLNLLPQSPGPPQPTPPTTPHPHAHLGALQAHEAGAAAPPHGGVSLGTPQGHSPPAAHNPAQGSEGLSAAQDCPGGIGVKEGQPPKPGVGWNGNPRSGEQ